MTPKTKKLLSGLAVAVVAAALASVQQGLANPPFTLHSLLVAAVAGATAGVVHYLPAFGTKADLDAKVLAGVTEAVDREAK